jgi:hypothetical protein
MSFDNDEYKYGLSGMAICTSNIGWDYWKHNSLYTYKVYFYGDYSCILDLRRRFGFLVRLKNSNTIYFETNNIDDDHFRPGWHRMSHEKYCSNENDPTLTRYTDTTFRDIFALNILKIYYIRLLQKQLNDIMNNYLEFDGL